MRRLFKELAFDTLAAVRSEHLWQQQDLGISDGAAALAASLVDVTSSNDAVQTDATHLFDSTGYCENPPGTRVPRKCCHEKYHGLCASLHSRVLERIQIAVFNVHQVLRRWRITAAHMPIMIDLCIGIDGVALSARRFFLTATVGTGQTQLLLPVTTFDRGRRSICRPLYVAAVVGAQPVVQPTTSNLALQAILEDASQVSIGHYLRTQSPF